MLTLKLSAVGQRCMCNGITALLASHRQAARASAGAANVQEAPQPGPHRAQLPAATSRSSHQEGGRARVSAARQTRAQRVAQNRQQKSALAATGWLAPAWQPRLLCPGEYATSHPRPHHSPAFTQVAAASISTWLGLRTGTGQSVCSTSASAAGPFFSMTTARMVSRTFA